MQKQTRKFRFTKTSVSKLKPEDRPIEYRDASLREFFIRVSPAGNKSYYCQYRVSDQGRRITYCMGAVSEYQTPEEARRQAGAIQYNAKHKGIDPKANKVAAREQERQRKQIAREDSEAHTLESFVDDVYDAYATTNQRAGKEVSKRIKTAFADQLSTRLDRLTAADIRSWQQKKLKAGMKPITINRYASDLRSCLNHAIELGVIESLPFDDLPKQQRKLKTGDDKRVRFLGQYDSHENITDNNRNKIGERQRLLAALEDDDLPKYMRPLVVLALNTGMRRGEIFSLVWADIDFKQQHIRLKAANTKTNKTRYVYLNTITDKLLRDWRKSQGNITSIYGLVFPNPVTGTRLTTVKRSWQTIIRKAQLQDFRLHDCRHDFASRLVQMGHSLSTVAELLGHSGVEITERYAHIADEQKRVAVDALVDV